MSFRALIFASLLISSFVVSADELTLIQPKNSPLKKTRVNHKELIAQFSGKIWIAGSLIMEQSTRVMDADAEYVLIPDRNSIARLPYFDGYKVKWIEIENGKEAFERAGGTTIAVSGVTDAKDGLRLLKISGTFEIADYVVGVDCDSPWARARVVESKVPDQRLVAALDPPNRC